MLAWVALARRSRAPNGLDVIRPPLALASFFLSLHMKTSMILTASSPPCLRWARLSAKQPVLLVRHLTTGMTVALFGRGLHSAPPTIPRFVGKLGFSSYREFPGALREGMEARAEYL